MAGVVLGVVAWAGTAAAGRPLGEWTFEWGPAWSVRGDFAKGKEMSAAAAFGPGEALAASDETRGAQRMSLDPVARAITVHELLPLLPGKGAELDLEGAAASTVERAYFLVGSLALSRQKAAFEPDRGFLFKLPVDGSNRPQPKAVAKVDLRAVLAADPEWAPFLNRTAEDHGLDIEGLAARDGRLYFGLRAPVLDGQAAVLEAGIGELFSGTAKLRHHRLAMGRGRGIRDIAALGGAAGFLVLVGPSGGPDSGRSAAGAKFELWHWPGPDSPPTLLGALGTVTTEAEANAEALLILNHTATRIDGIVFHDGPKNGAPHGFSLTPTPAP